jgi:hypothetical protein
LELVQKAIEAQFRKTQGFEGLRSEPFRFGIFTRKEIEALRRRGDIQAVIAGTN